MTLTTLVDVRAGPSGGGKPVVDLRGARTNGAGVADAPDVAHLLASRLVAGLDDRPFRPTADQLARVWGGDLVRGERRENRARIAAGRYAALFTDHVVQDVAVAGGPGAYARIWALRSECLHREHVLGGSRVPKRRRGLQVGERRGRGRPSVVPGVPKALNEPRCRGSAGGPDTTQGIREAPHARRR